MELPALIAVLVDAILAQCPQYDRVSVTVALESVFAGHPAALGDNTISMLLGQNNDFTNATITIGSVHAGHTITVQLPQPIDSLPAALAALASIPLKEVPKPRSDLPHASRLPFEASQHFVGREVELKALAQAIGTAQPAVVMPAVTTGLGGIGKTSLVTEFAYRYGVYFHGGVFWLNCADPDQVASQIAACALDLGINTTGMALDEQVQRVLKEWKSPMPRLLIFDNCEDRAILEQWKPTVGGCRVLVTARSDQWPTLTQIRLGLLPPAESRALLQRLCTRLTDTEADAIAEDLGHLPLALHLAGSYLTTYSHHTVAQYQEDLTIAHRSLKGRGALPSPTRHELDVEATFMLSFSQLDPTNALDSLALGMLDGAAWCAPGVPIPRDLVLAFVPDGTDGDDTVDALRRLQQLGLLNGADAVVLHRLLAQVIYARLGSTDMLAMVEERIGATAFRANETGVPRSMLPLEPHLRHATMRALDRNEERSALLVNNLGFFEDLREAYGEAQGLYERALVINEAVFGREHPETATSMNNVAFVLSRQGRYGEAQGLYERALAIKESMLGREHPDTAVSVNNLAGVLASQGRYGEAQGLYERALAIKESMLGREHPDTAVSVNNLAGVLASQGRYGEAQGLYERALAIKESMLGREHLDTARSVNNLAFILSQQGLYGEAQGLYERALVIIESVLGRDHSDTATSMNNVAFVLSRQGRYGEAQGLYERALAVTESVLGREHPDTATSMNNLAVVLSRQGRYAEAQELFEQALAVTESVLGREHPDTATSMNNLAMAFLNQGQYAEAQELFERALTVTESVLGREHPDTATSMNNLALVLSRQGQHAEAQELFEQALAVTESVLGTDHPETRIIRANVVLCRQQSGHQSRSVAKQGEKPSKRDQRKGWK